MGRRPNAIVQEYFHRGQKLTDASNRYVHTCKRCGVIFPKGRVDSLMSHLLRRCPSITQEDRHLIYDAIQQQNPDLHRIQRQDDAKLHPQHHQQHYPPGFGAQQPDIPLPLLLQSEPSALDTLAEVSRRHLDYSSQRHAGDASPGAGRDIAEQALLAQLQGGAAIPFLATSLPGSAGSHGSVQPELGDDVQTHHFLEPTVTTTIPSSPLIHAASAANRELEHAVHPGSRDVLDPELEAQAGPPHPNTTRGEQDPLNMSWSPTNVSDAESYGQLPGQMQPTDFMPDAQSPRRTLKHRRRGQFSDTRRKEVQEIRKRGACIRCRMLKKSCSEGTPCSTCKSVESARLWKSSCLRTRLADAFTLWSSGLYHSRAKIEVPASVHGHAQHVLPGRIEVQLFPQSQLCLTFAVRRYTKPPSPLRDVPGHGTDSSVRDPRVPQPDTTSDILLLDEGEGMSSKIEEYANEVLAACVAAESSLFIRKTLENAQMLIEAEEREGPEGVGPGAPRSCYNLQSQQLLKNVVELWVETIILAARQRLNPRLVYNPIEQPHQRPASARLVPTNGSAGEQTAISSHSETLIFAQLLAATESRCFALSRSVMNEIERRLLQRQQVSRFSTFISSVVLLNCIERMTGVYRANDKAPSMSIAALHLQDAESPSESTLYPNDLDVQPPNWPLEHSPRKYWLQGAQFADLLIMLLRMRALPPKTAVTAEAKLVVSQEHPLPASISRRSTQDQTDEQQVPASWLNPLQLTVDELIQKRDGAFPEHDQDVSNWDLKFISRVLLPEGFM